jgi:hypothetical protein
MTTASCANWVFDPQLVSAVAIRAAGVGAKAPLQSQLFRKWFRNRNNDRKTGIANSLTMVHFRESVNPSIGRSFRKESKCVTAR